MYCADIFSSSEFGRVAIFLPNVTQFPTCPRYHQANYSDKSSKILLIRGFSAFGIQIFNLFMILPRHSNGGIMLKTWDRVQACFLWDLVQWSTFWWTWPISKLPKILYDKHYSQVPWALTGKRGFYNWHKASTDTWMMHVNMTENGHSMIGKARLEYCVFRWAKYKKGKTSMDMAFVFSLFHNVSKLWSCFCEILTPSLVTTFFFFGGGGFDHDRWPWPWYQRKRRPTRNKQVQCDDSITKHSRGFFFQFELDIGHWTWHTTLTPKKMCYPRNINVKYETVLTYYSKVMANVKVLLQTNWKTGQKLLCLRSINMGA